MMRVDNLGPIGEVRGTMYIQPSSQDEVAAKLASYVKPHVEVQFTEQVDPAKRLGSELLDLA